MSKVLKRCMALLAILILTFSGLLSINASWMSPSSQDFISDKNNIIVFLNATEKAKENISKILDIPKDTISEFTQEVLYQPISTEIEDEKENPVAWYDIEDKIIYFLANFILNYIKHGDLNVLQHEITHAFICNYLGKDAVNDRFGVFFNEGIADLCDDHVNLGDDLNLDEADQAYKCMHISTFSNLDISIENEIHLHSYFKEVMKTWLGKRKITVLKFLDRVKAGETSKDVFFTSGGEKVLRECKLMNFILELYEN